MAALWPSLMWPPVLEAFYHAKTGVQKDFTMKHCLGEIMGGKAHKMIIQYKKQIQDEKIFEQEIEVWEGRNEGEATSHLGLATFYKLLTCKLENWFIFALHVG